jgi:hypothetical protein
LLYCYIVIVFFQGISGWVSKRDRVLGNWILVVLLWLQYTVHVTLGPMIKIMHLHNTTSRNTRAVPCTAVFRNSFMLFLPGMLFRDFFN